MLWYIVYHATELTAQSLKRKFTDVIIGVQNVDGITQAKHLKNQSVIEQKKKENSWRKNKMDTSKFVGGNFVSVEVVKNSRSKKLVILGEGSEEEVTFGKDTKRMLTIPVEIDGQPKLWRPNQDSIKNMWNVSKDSKQWNGIIVNLQIQSRNQKEMVVGFPDPTSMTPMVKALFSQTQQ